MAKKRLPIYDERMMLLMQHCIDGELCDTQEEFLKGIGFSPTGLRQVRLGLRSFTVEQITAAAKKYKINPNWILGFSSDMKLKKSETALQMLKDAVRMIEAELKQ